MSRVPTEAAASPAATATAEPELDPPGSTKGVPSASSPVAYGFSTWPPSEEYPDGIPMAMMLANSVRLVLPSSTAPAARSFATTVASRAAVAPASASAPAVVGSSSPVATLSFTTTGMPSSSRRRPVRPSLAVAMAAAVGLTRRRAFSRGPARSKASMRAR